MPIQLFPVVVNFIVNARISTNKIVEFLGAVEVDNKRRHLQQVFKDDVFNSGNLHEGHSRP